MARWSHFVAVLVIGGPLSAIVACGDDDDDGGTEADRIGIGAACDDNADCLEGQTCLAFKGGYCGLMNCVGDELLGCDDAGAGSCCPEGSKCVTHDDGVNYCFRECDDKATDCNRNRPVEFESNCSANITFVLPPDPETQEPKACVPPS